MKKNINTLKFFSAFFEISTVLFFVIAIATILVGDSIGKSIKGNIQWLGFICIGTFILSTLLAFVCNSLKRRFDEIVELFHE